MKTCKTYRTDNYQLRPNPALVKTGFANDLMKIEPLILAEWAFLYFLSAHLIDEITEFSLISDICNSIRQGNILNYSGLNPGLYKNAIASGYLFFILPVILWIIPYFIIISVRIKISISDYLKNFSLIFIPVFAGLFVGLIIMEIVTRLPYYKYIVHDVRGIDTIRAIITRQIMIPHLPVWVEWCLLLSMLTGTFIGILISFKVIHRLSIKFKIQKNKLLFLKILPFVFVIVFFVEVLLYKCF